MIKKLDMKTADKVESNIEQIAQLFPNVMSEGKVDFELLKQMLSDEVLDTDDERYRLDWVGKKASLLKANSSINKTLRPCKEESVDFDTTENLYIEGDNFEVLKLLQESYLNKVKMIYIDPPYNTGKDFVYKDNFTQSKADFEDEIGLRDEDDNKLFKNTDSNGRFHSDWLSMMYERLLVSRDLLKDDGVIFISIDDNEVHNLRKLCDEVFGEGNFVAELIWSLNSGTQAGYFTRSHETILSYAKNSLSLSSFKDFSGGTIKHGALKKISKVNPSSDILFPKGCIECEDKNSLFTGTIGGSEKQFIKGEMIFVNGVLDKDVTIEAGWAMKNQVLSWIKGKETHDSKGQKVIRFYFNSQGILFYEKERGTQHPKTVLLSESVGNTRRGGQDILELFSEKVMDFPKPIKLINFLTSLIAQSKDEIILDFFSGSATTAHAVMQLNAEDGGNRKHICVQIPELTDEKSEAYKAGYKNICEIGKERIRRAGKKILEDNESSKEPKDLSNLDIGFRVLKIDSSNMKDVHFHPNKLSQDLFAELESNIKEDRDNLDLLFGVMLDLGVELSLKITPKIVDSKTIYILENKELVACFEDNISLEVIEEIKNQSPYKIVLKDECFESDKDKINAVESLSKVCSVSVI